MAGRVRAPRLVGAAWVVVTAAGLVAVLVGWTSLDVPGWVTTAGAATITTTYAFGLAARTGGRPLIAGGLALLLVLVAVLWSRPVLLAGATVSTAVLAAVLGVMSTKPAVRLGGQLRELAVALLVAGVGALAAEAYQAQVSLDRVGYLVLSLSLLGAIGLVYRLGAGLHGVGRRGAIMLVSGIALLFVSLAYTEALSRWGSPGMVQRVEQVFADVRSGIGAVPRPIEFVLGFPALVWGISTRARRRQGWWVCAFGTVGLAAVSVSLLDPRMSLREGGLTVLYSAVLGVGLGYLVIRADTFLTGARGRRARRLEAASAHRPEPGRFEPLL